MPIGSLFPKTDFYVQVFEDRIRVRNLRTGQSVDQQPELPYSHPRALVGHFMSAEITLKAALKDVQGSRLRMWQILIQPMATLEGGLTQIEERALLELALGAGALRAVVWVGEQLSDEAVRDKLR